MKRRYEINKIIGTFNLVVYEIVGYKEEELVTRLVFMVVDKTKTFPTAIINNDCVTTMNAEILWYNFDEKNV